MYVRGYAPNATRALSVARLVHLEHGVGLVAAREGPDLIAITAVVCAHEDGAVQPGKGGRGE